ncbi:MAG: hypothetical protein J5822_02695 [Eubacteriaceae bacterium]|nr:hypothetical protein [Eubacteriaceae bacterium]
MHGARAGFVIWAACALVFAVLGIRCFYAKSAVGFWANAKGVEVSDVRGYNRAVGKLFIGFAVYFVLIGLPLLTGNAALLMVVTLIGTVAGSIGMMVIYAVGISRKYGVRQK